MLKFNKQTVFILAVGALASLIGIPDYNLSFDEKAEPVAFLDVHQGKEKCELKVIVKADVLLSHPVEIHAESGAVPGAYTAVDKDFAQLDQLITASTEDSEEDILARLKSPAPNHFIIGEVLSYSMRVVEKFNCVKNPPQKPLPDAPTKD